MKAPKEIYLLGQDLEFMVNDGMHELYFVDVSLTDVLGGQIKYLSEESVNQILQEKGLQEIELNHTKTLLSSCEKALEERNKMLSEKDKEIDRLKSENQKLNKVELFRYEHGFEACSIVYLINGEIHLYSIPMYGGEEKEEYIDFIDLEDLIEKIKKFT